MKAAVRPFYISILVGLLVAALAVPSFAAPAAGDSELRRLVRENAVAKQIADLNLTAEQRTALKEVLLGVKAAGASFQEALIPLLEQRRDALLGGDRERVAALEKEIRQLARERYEDVRGLMEPFISGLTERQTVALRNLLHPGGAWLKAGRHFGPGARFGERWMGRPDGRREMVREKIIERFARPEPPRREGERPHRVMPGRGQQLRPAPFSRPHGPGMLVPLGFAGERLDLIVELLDRAE